MDFLRFVGCGKRVKLGKSFEKRVAEIGSKREVKEEGMRV